MNMITGMRLEPSLHGRMLVRRVVIHDEMNAELPRDRAVNLVQEMDEFQ